MGPSNLNVPGNPGIMNNSNAPIPLSEGTGMQAQDALQALLAMATNLNSFSSQQNNHGNSETQSNATHNQSTYLNILVEDVLLFTVGSRDDALPRTTCQTKRR